MKAFLLFLVCFQMMKFAQSAVQCTYIVESLEGYRYTATNEKITQARSDGSGSTTIGYGNFKSATYINGAMCGSYGPRQATIYWLNSNTCSSSDNRVTETTICRYTLHLCSCAAVSNRGCITITNIVGGWPAEVRWRILDGKTNCERTTSKGPNQCCGLTPGNTYTIECMDTYGDTWNGNVVKFDGQRICSSMQTHRGRNWIQDSWTFPALLPTSAPTELPTETPTMAVPSIVPTYIPSITPTLLPTVTPTNVPTKLDLTSCITITRTRGGYPYEVRWRILNTNCAQSSSNGPNQCCGLTPGNTYTIECRDTFGDTWNGNIVKFNGQTICSSMQNHRGRSSIQDSWYFPDATTNAPRNSKCTYIVEAPGYIYKATNTKIIQLQARSDGPTRLTTIGFGNFASATYVNGNMCGSYGAREATINWLNSNTCSPSDNIVTEPTICRYTLNLCPCAVASKLALAGGYTVWYQGHKRGTNMIINCDNTCTQPGIFTDKIRTDEAGLKEYCGVQARDAGSTMYILNTHGAGKFECLKQIGTTIKGQHYMGKWHYYGTIEYRMLKDVECEPTSSTENPTVIPTTIPSFNPTIIPSIHPTIIPTYIAGSDYSGSGSVSNDYPADTTNGCEYQYMHHRAMGLGLGTTCLIDQQSHLHCLGDDSYGQISGTPSSGTYSMISNGFYHQCAIQSITQAISCWGKDSDNQVSDAPISGTYSMISSRSSHNCALDSTTQSITCWGRDDFNQISHTPTSGAYDMISSGNFHNCALHSTTKSITCWGRDNSNQISHTPTSGAYDIISSGSEHNCALHSTTKSITCWGSDYYNQISDTPTSGAYDMISSGSSHNCAVHSTTHSITCWGSNAFHVISNTPISGTYSMISSGVANNCAVHSITQSLTCWGRDDLGQISEPNNANIIVKLPSNCIDSTNGCAYQYMHHRSMGLGLGTTCFIDQQSHLHCFGSNTHGQISTTPSSGTYSMISNGFYHQCAIQSITQAITCWGRDSDNQVSDAPISGTYSMISSYSYHNCAIHSITQSITCWGKDSHNQISNTPISGAYNMISSGKYHNCALHSTTQSITCWGDDSYNQISDTPISSAFDMISSGSSHNCALHSTTKSITCWGKDSNNQISDTPISGVYDMISSGSSHNCAIHSITHSITCWGWNAYNAISDTPISGTYSMISSGVANNCAVHSITQSLTCWGKDHYGQISGPNNANIIVKLPSNCMTQIPSTEAGLASSSLSNKVFDDNVGNSIRNQKESYTTILKGSLLFFVAFGLLVFIHSGTELSKRESKINEYTALLSEEL